MDIIYKYMTISLSAYSFSLSPHIRLYAFKSNFYQVMWLTSLYFFKNAADEK